MGTHWALLQRAYISFISVPTNTPESRRWAHRILPILQIRQLRFREAHIQNPSLQPASPSPAQSGAPVFTKIPRPKMGQNHCLSPHPFSHSWTVPKLYRHLNVSPDHSLLSSSTTEAPVNCLSALPGQVQSSPILPPLLPHPPHPFCTPQDSHLSLMHTHLFIHSFNRQLLRAYYMPCSSVGPSNEPRQSP